MFRLNSSSYMCDYNIIKYSNVKYFIVVNQYEKIPY